jgi:hypothetical protein
METQSPASHSDPEPGPPSLTQPVSESSARHSAIRKAVAPVPPPEEVEQDMRLESELVLLVSQLDYVRTLLDESIAQRSPGAILQSSVEMLKTVCAFAEQYPEADAGGATLGKARETLTWMQQLERQVNESGLQSFLGMFRKRTFTATECQRLFGQVRVAVPDLIGQFCTLFSTAFHSPETARQWTQTYGLFLADLTNSFSKLEG